MTDVKNTKIEIPIEPFVMLPKWLVYVATPNEFMVYATLQHHGGVPGQENWLVMFPSIETIAEMTNLSASTVKRTLKSMEDKNLFKKSKDKKFNSKYVHNVYTLTYTLKQYINLNGHNPKDYRDKDKIVQNRRSNVVHGTDIIDNTNHRSNDENHRSNQTKPQVTSDLLTISNNYIHKNYIQLENPKDFQQISNKEELKEFDTYLKQNDWFLKNDKGKVPGKKQTLYKNAIASIFYDDLDDVSSTEWNKIGGAAKSLFESRVSPLGIGLLAQNIAKTWGEGAVTVTSLPQHTDLRYEARDKGKEEYNINQVNPAIEAKHTEMREKAHIEAQLAPRKKAYNDKRIINNEQPVHLDNITEEMLKEAGL